MTIHSFEELNINENLKNAIRDMNFTSPTPIQAQAIPIVLNKQDIIGQAQTGTGKTAAFAIPILENIDTQDFSIQALIMSPTRELAIQISKEIRKLTKYLENIRVVPVYGGQSYDIQINALKKKPQIIIGTPGRIIDLMKRSLLKFNNIKTVVLDEADEMLKMGFQEDLETILQATPNTRQTVMFSATMPKTILDIANTYLKNYEMIKIENKTVTVEKIEQLYFTCKNEQKVDLLIRLLDFYKVDSSIVFCNTKKDVDELVVKLQNHNYVTEGIHGDLKQSQRDRVMNSFRSNHVQILVATDVAARGLDIDDVEAVFNYDCPMEEESYVHRIGRTGRAGKSGRAFTFVTKRQEYRIRQIEIYTNSKINKGKIPTIEDIKHSKSREMYKVIKENLDLNNVYELNSVIEDLLKDGYTKDQVINVLFHMINNDTLKEYEEIEEVSFEKKREKRRDNSEGRIANRNDRRDNKPSNERKERSFDDRKKSGKRALIHINIGSRENVRIPDLFALLIDRNNINKNDIGTIEITKKGTYVELYEKDANKLIKASNTHTLKNNEVRLEIIK